MVPRDNKNNAYAKFGETSKEYCCIFRNVYYNLLLRNTLCQFVLTETLFKLFGKYGELVKCRLARDIGK